MGFIGVIHIRVVYALRAQTGKSLKDRIAISSDCWRCMVQVTMGGLTPRRLGGHLISRYHVTSHIPTFALQGSSSSQFITHILHYIYMYIYISIPHTSYFYPATSILSLSAPQHTKFRAVLVARHLSVTSWLSCMRFSWKQEFRKLLQIN